MAYHAVDGFFATLSGAGTSAVGTWIRSNLKRLAQQRDLMRMAQMDEYLLADIGLAFDDIYLAQQLPWSQDPICFLRSRARERGNSLRYC